MEICELNIPGLCVVTPRRFSDTRGWFSETYSAAAWERAGLPTSFVQDNHSYTAQQGTFRGLHFQAPPHAQTKLVRATRGRVFDVTVDLRRGSPTYGHSEAVELSAENGRQLLVPEGLAHGFLTLTPDCEVQYKCTHAYAPQAEGGVFWNDPGLAIDWPSEAPVTAINERDHSWPSLADFDSPFEYPAEGVVS